MTLVLTSIALISGATLGFLKDLTDKPIEYQKLKYVKGPAVIQVLEPFENDPIRDAITHVTLQTHDTNKSTYTFFPATRDSLVAAIAFEVPGKGYGGDMAIMIGIDLDSGTLTGIRLLDHSETPGLGARASEPGFYNQFSGLSGDAVALSGDGGNIQSLSGASITSRGIADAVRKALEFFSNNREQILESLEEPIPAGTREASP